MPHSSLSVLRPGGLRPNSTKTVSCEVKYKAMNWIQRAQDTVKLYNIMEKVKNVLSGESVKFIEWVSSSFWGEKNTPLHAVT